MMRIWNTIRNLIVRGRVDRSGDKPQIAWLGERITPDVEHLQGPGIYFIAPADAFGAIFAPGGDPSVAMVVGLDGTRPAAPAEGEGGLHYLGTWKIFLAADRTTHVGRKDPDDWAAIASTVDSLFSQVNTQIEMIKNAVSVGLNAVGAGATANGPAGATAYEGALPAEGITLETVASSEVRIHKGSSGGPE